MSKGSEQYDLCKAAEELIEAWDWDWSEPRNEALRERIKELRKRMKALRQALKQPKWVGLEDEDVAIVKNEFNRGALWAEQVLKEKNT